MIADLRDLAIDLAADSYSQTTLEMLQRDLRCSVASALGASISFRAGRAPDVALRLDLVSRTVEPAEIASALRLPLEHLLGGTTGSVTFYATEPSAFVQLAADLVAVLQLPPGDLDEDPPLPVEPLRPGVSGLQDFAPVDLAVGVLMGRGLGLEQARAELRRRADKAGAGLFEAAHALLDSYC